MYTIFSVLIVITCVLLVLVVLVQNPKGGGLSATFGGGNQVMGVKKTADFLEKATWYLAIALLVFISIKFCYLFYQLWRSTKPVYYARAT